MSLIKLKEKIKEHDKHLLILTERCLNERDPINPNEWDVLDKLELEIKEIASKIK